MLQFPQHPFCAFFSQMMSCDVCIMTSFIIPPHQFSIFEDVGVDSPAYWSPNLPFNLVFPVKIILLTKRNLTVYTLCKTLYNVLSHTHGLICGYAGWGGWCSKLCERQFPDFRSSVFTKSEPPHPPRLCNTAQLKQRYISTKLLVLNLINLWQPYNLSLSVRYRRRNKRFNASSLKVERFCSTNSRGNACYEGKYNQLNPIYSWDFWATVLAFITGALWAKRGELVHHYRLKILALFLWRLMPTRKSL